MRRTPAPAAPILMGVLWSAVGLAQAPGPPDSLVPIVNGSFEFDPIARGDFVAADPPTGWTAQNSSGAFLLNDSQGKFPLGMPDGQAIALRVRRGSRFSMLYQRLPALRFAANTTYTLSGYQGFPNTTAQFNAGGKLELYGSNDNFSHPLITVPFAAASAPVGGFQFKSGSYTTGRGGGPIGGVALLRIEAADGSATQDSVSVWDDIRLTAGVSVPITNASFESPAIASGASLVLPIEQIVGWSTRNPSASAYSVLNDGALSADDPRKRFPLGMPASGKALSVTVRQGSPLNVLVQRLGQGFEPNKTYTLSGYQGFDRSLQDRAFNGGGRLDLYGSADNDTTPLITLDFAPGSAPIGGFQFKSGSFTTGAAGGAVGGTALIRIHSYDADPRGRQDSAASWSGIALTLQPAVPQSRGRALIAERGLQIGATDGLGRGPGASSDPKAVADWLHAWGRSNFTTINFQYEFQQHDWLLARMPVGQLWARWSSADLEFPLSGTAHETDFRANLFSIQYLDELPGGPLITGPDGRSQSPGFDAATIAGYRAAFDLWRSRVPSALVFTNFAGLQLDAPHLRAFLEATRPDALHYDLYPILAVRGCVPIPITREGLYAELEKYRAIALAGIAADGSQPIPFGQYLQGWAPCGYRDARITETFVRQQQFASWTFGASLVTAFVYEDWGQDQSGTQRNGIFAQLFDRDGRPTPVFDYFAATNRMSRNLSQALVRLKSTHVRIVPGKVDGIENPAIPTVARWSRGADPFITAITPRGAANSAAPATTCDWLIGYFLPLRANNADYPFAEGLHFMATNGSTTETSRSPGAAGGAEWVRIEFDFSSTTFNSLERLSRTSGRVEVIDRESQGWTALGNHRYRLDLQEEGGTGDLFRFATH